MFNFSPEQSRGLGAENGISDHLNLKWRAPLAVDKISNPRTQKGRLLEKLLTTLKLALFKVQNSQYFLFPIQSLTTIQIVNGRHCNPILLALKGHRPTSTIIRSLVMRAWATCAASGQKMAMLPLVCHFSFQVGNNIQLRLP